MIIDLSLNLCIMTLPLHQALKNRNIKDHRNFFFSSFILIIRPIIFIKSGICEWISKIGNCLNTKKNNKKNNQTIENRPAIISCCNTLERYMIFWIRWIRKPDLGSYCPPMDWVWAAIKPCEVVRPFRLFEEEPKIRTYSVCAGPTFSINHRASDRSKRNRDSTQHLHRPSSMDPASTIYRANHRRMGLSRTASDVLNCFFFNQKGKFKYWMN